MPTFMLEYRPSTYWDEPERTIARVKGTLRQNALRDERRGQGETAIPDILRESSLPPEIRALVGHMNPAMRSGEDLPDLFDDEAEIARILYPQTVRCEVRSVRARPDGAVIRYRLVDDSGLPEDSFTLPQDSSTVPLSMRDVIALIDGVRCADRAQYDRGLVLGDMDWRNTQEGQALADLLGFIIVSSDYYPELESWYRHACTKWISLRMAGHSDLPSDSLAVMQLPLQK